MTPVVISVKHRGTGIFRNRYRVYQPSSSFDRMEEKASVRCSSWCSFSAMLRKRQADNLGLREFLAGLIFAVIAKRFHRKKPLMFAL